MTSRLSLSSSAFEGRIRKYDTHTHALSRSQRPIHRPQQPVVLRPTPVVHIEKSAPIVASQILDTPRPQEVQKIAPFVVPQSRGVQQTRSSLPLQAVSHSRGTNEDIIADQFDPALVEPAKRRHRSSKLQKVFYAFGMTAFLFAMFASGFTIFNNTKTKQQLEVLGQQTGQVVEDEQGVPEGSGDKPSEAEPSANAISSYRPVDPESPRFLIIPDLKLKSRVKSLGEDKKGAVAAPGNVHDVGWYNGSVKPGNPVGASLLVAHVSGWTTPGAFKKLHTLKPGARFQVERGNGEKITYEVTKTENFPVDSVPMGKILSPETKGAHDIKLMTCGGKFDSKSDSYTERVVVYGKQLK